MIDLIKTIFLGIIQGITEWLPISSTGHLILFSSIWPLEPAKFFEVFKVVIQFGSILAVLVLYYQKLNPFDARKSAKKKKQTLQLWSKVIVGVIPAAIIGLLLDNIIEEYLSKNIVIAITLIVYGIIFILVEKRPNKEKIQTIEYLDYKSALKIGCLYCGCSRTVASEFSFFLAIPVMFGASLLKVIKYLLKVGLFSFGQLFLLLLGTFVAFVVSLFAIKALLNYVKNHDFTVFGWYRIILGVFVILFFYVL